MKKLFLLLPVILIGVMLFMGQKSLDSEKWNTDPSMTRIQPSDDYSPYLPTLPKNFVFTTEPRMEGPYLVGPNVRPYPTTNTHQSEVIIVRHPTNQNFMWASANMTTVSGTLFISEGVYVTTNGGLSWFGSDTLAGAPINNHGGDPGPYIDHNGVMVMSHLGYSTAGMFANYSTDFGMTWSPTATLLTGSQDKNLANVDDDPSSPYYGRGYVVWTDFRSTVKPIYVSWTSNGGQTWSTAAPINNPPSPLTTSQGCDVVVGPGGVVYSTWRDHGASPFTGVRVGLGKSTDGGVTWTVQNQAFAMNGVRSASFGSYGIRVPDFPRIDIDKTGGARHGWIYIVTNEVNLAPAGSDADIIMNTSTDGGTTWSRTRVNQDPMNNGKLQFFPAVRVDEFGGVNVVYYDNRNTAADSAQVYVARSIDGGVTWTEILTSDHRFRPRAISGLAGGYSGDYIGITSGSGKLWPVWMDNSTGNYQLWTAYIQLATYPLNTFNLQTPSPGTTITTYPNSTTSYTFNWDTSASTASYKWIFGNPTPVPRKITLNAGSNSLTVTSDQLDQILAGLGVAQGGSLAGQWDVWAFRNNLPQNDSMKAANGPRTLTLTRGIPPLTAFNLSSPPNNFTLHTTSTDFTSQNFNWTKSGQGVKYKWMFASPDFSSPGNIKRIYESANSGFDSTVGIRKSALDSLAASLGASNTDSIQGQWRIYAYSAGDSLSSAQTHNITLRRLPIFTITIGTGTSQEAYPLDRYFNYMRWQGLWTNSELNNFTGNILKIRFYQNNSVSDNMQNVKIWMMETPQSTLPTGNWDSTGMSLVYSGNVQTMSSPGWLEINLTTPFSHTAGNNLMISCTRDFQQYITSYPQFAYTSTPTYLSRRNRSDTQYPVSLTQSFLRGNIQIEYTTATGIEGNLTLGVPNVYTLGQNYPNPFNPSTKINFGIPRSGLVTIKVYDLLGKEIATLINEEKQAGYYDIEFNASHLASGAYFYRIQSNDFVETRRMMLIK
jgi:hypothetical protein